MSPQPSNSRSPYQKPWRSYPDQLAALVARGLVVNDHKAVQAFLAHVNYYRFSGYCLAFEQQRHQFSGGCTFEQIRSAYEFDMTLRDLVTEALEVLEVDFRTAIAYSFGEKHGAFGHTNPANFFSSFKHDDWLLRLRDEADRSSELFVEHFKSHYAQFPDLPIWMAMEVMSFGGLSKMFQGMLRDDQKAVARRYAVQPRDLVTILHHLVYIRNLCAHHSRLWDRIWRVTPTLPKGNSWQAPHVPSNDRLFSTLLLLYYLMRCCPTMNGLAKQWRDRLKQHLSQPPSIQHPFDRMGMPSNWDRHPGWK